jgi:hypothetical protein
VAVKYAFETGSDGGRMLSHRTVKSPVQLRQFQFRKINQCHLCSRIKSESGGFLNPHLRRLFLLLQAHIFATLQ